ncbi:MAG: porin family protein [Alphaproteobacteria bacterium]
MQVRNLFLSAAAVFVLAVPAAASAPGGFYAEAAGGVTFTDLEINGFDEDMETGWNIGGAVGTHVTPNLAAELDIFYNDAGLECCSGESLNTLSFMLDAIYGFNPDGFVNPYLGAGVGTVRLEGVDGSFSDSDWKFGYQAMAGLLLNVSQTVGVFAEYRFHDAVGDADIFNVDVGYQSHNASAGIRVNF